MVKGLMKKFDCVLPLAKVEEDEVHLPLAKLRKRIKNLVCLIGGGGGGVDNNSSLRKCCEQSFFLYSWVDGEELNIPLIWVGRKRTKASL